jgi:hypothetical protein
MATEGEIKPTHIRNPETKRDPRDVNARGIMLFLAFLVVFALFVHLGILGLMGLFDKGYVPTDTNRSPILTAVPSQAPPLPRLQPDPVGDLNDLRQQEDQILEGYAWTDQGAGKVRIPVARAMQLLVQRGLPNATGAVPAATAQGATSQPSAPGKAAQRSQLMTPSTSPSGRATQVVSHDFGRADTNAKRKPGL